MKFERTDCFRSDYKKLSERERLLFCKVVHDIDDAYVRHQNKGMPIWPQRLRIKPVQGAAGVWEVTWSFSGPDGRATFEIIKLNGESIMRWRRIGGHQIFKNP